MSTIGCRCRRLKWSKKTHTQKHTYIPIWINNFWFIISIFSYVGWCGQAKWNYLTVYIVGFEKQYKQTGSQTELPMYYINIHRVRNSKLRMCFSKPRENLVYLIALDKQVSRQITFMKNPLSETSWWIAEKTDFN